MWAGQKRKELALHGWEKQYCIPGWNDMWNIGIRRRIKTEANARKKVEKVVEDRQLARVLSRHTCMAYRDDGTDRETAEGAGL